MVQYIKAFLFKLMVRGTIVVAAFLFVNGFASGEFLRDAEVSTFNAEEINMRNYLTPDTADLFKIAFPDEQADLWREVKEFYEAREYFPAWTNGVDAISQIDGLLSALMWAEEEGLDPDKYMLGGLQGQFDKAIRDDFLTPEEQFEIDLALTQLYMLYALHLNRGRIHPDHLERGWYIKPITINWSQYLTDALARGRVEASLKALVPGHEGYQKLKDKLVYYQDISRNGGWAKVPPGKTLRPGQKDSAQRLRLLEDRLSKEGYLPSGGAASYYPELAETGTANATPDTGVYDPRLSEGVREFQERNGLEATGTLTSETVALLNVTPEERISAIKLNMERWRWLPEKLGNRFVFVNIPSFHVEYVENGYSKLQSNVVVGKISWKTPSFSDEIEHVIFNPYWNVPPSITRLEMVPILRSNPGYFVNNNFQFLNSQGQPVSPYAVSAGGLASGTYRMRQRPGPGNALGRVKIVFPNRFNVYLHDTPSKHLFEETVRGFSHGCIRVQKPVELAEVLLSDQPEWTPERIQQVIASGENTWVRTSSNIPIYVVYMTSYINSDGEVEFRPDVYNLDHAHMQKLSYQGYNDRIVSLEGLPTLEGWPEISE